MPRSPLASVSSPRFIVREATRKDLGATLRLARLLNSINLPGEKRALTDLIDRSRRSFRGKIPQKQHAVYLFVLEDRLRKKLAGASLILAKHGTPELPHYYLEMDTDERYSRTLKKVFRHTYLHLRRSMNGPTEVGGLIVDPAYRRHPEKLGKQLSYVRFLYMAMHRHRFEKEVLAEMRPPLTEKGESQFWEWYGKKVTGLDFREADKLSMRDKEFIDALFPTTRMYTCMFPPQVQNQLGQVGEESRSAAYLLKKIGLKFLHHIDPFDGGPFYGGRLDDLLLIKRHRRCTLHADYDTSLSSGGREFLLGREDRRGFFAAKVRGQQKGNVLILSRPLLAHLSAREGEVVSCVPFL